MSFGTTIAGLFQAATTQRPGRIASLIYLLGCVTAVAGPTNPPAGMAFLPAGIYKPAFRQTNEPASLEVNSIYLDCKPVTNDDYLTFVRARPEWQKSRVRRLFADDQYLVHWQSDLEFGASVDPQSPVTRVSWFAARAYARWQGKRLPTIAEWEYAAVASARNADGTTDRDFRAALQKIYTSPSPLQLPQAGAGSPNYYGLYDMHGLVWEWVSDFNTSMVTGDARGDTGLERQLYCGSGAQGAKDITDFAAFMRYAFRSSLQAPYTVPNLGFRCAKDAL
jgi:formylglycine-generating enzyme